MATKVTLPQDGRVWHFHPVEFVGQFGGDLIDVEAFVALYSEKHIDFQPGTRALNAKSKENLREVVKQINSYAATKDEVITIYELAYMFATARHEMYDWNKLEYFSDFGESGNVSYFNIYDPVLAATEILRVKARRHENVQQGDGYKYRGRGVVHLTWRRNYRLASEFFNIDFVNHPDWAALHQHSVPIMIWGMKAGIFTGAKISKYLNNPMIMSQQEG